MEFKKFLFKVNLIIKKFSFHVFLLGLLGIMLLFQILHGLNLAYKLEAIIALTFIIYSALSIFYKTISQRIYQRVHELKNSEHSSEKNMLKALFNVGQLCSWQYSVNAGILKFDAEKLSFMGSKKQFYTKEELYMNNSYIKELLIKVDEKSLRVIDEELYFPDINKWVIVRGQCIDGINEKPTKYIGVLLDNTDRKETYKKLEEISITDELTGLKNRRYFFELLEQELKLSQRETRFFSTAIIDLDFFKKINDTYGHLAGDFVLKEFSRIMVSEVRPYDVVARFGGEEFIILFPGIFKEDAENIILRIKHKVEDLKFIFNEKSIPVSFSCGLGDSRELRLYTDQEFIDIIDSRLYSAKKLGRNLVVTGG